MPGKHEVKELQKTAILGTAHILPNFTNIITTERFIKKIRHWYLHFRTNFVEGFKLCGFHPVVYTYQILLSKPSSHNLQ